jgi:hypothetical protein
MRTFIRIGLDLNALSSELDDLEGFLSSQTHLKEREQVSPFSKARPNLCAALGRVNSAVESPDRLATELDLFGDFVCDVAAGDSEANAYTLVEFEDARKHSVFTRLAEGKTIKRWSPRFEHGFSQLVDWAWRISAESGTTAAFQRIFGNSDSSIHFLLIVGRDADLSKDDLVRLRWRANHTSLGRFECPA